MSDVAFLSRHDEEISFYHDVAEVLHRMREAGVVIAACSRTHTPKLYVLAPSKAKFVLLTCLCSARRALSLLLVPPQVGRDRAASKPAIEFFDQLELYPGENPHAILRLQRC